MATLCPQFLYPKRRNPDEVLDAHGHVRLQSVGELHSFFRQPHRMDIILNTRRVWLPNEHPSRPRRGPTGPSWPSQLALEQHDLPPDAANPLLVVFSLALLGPLVSLPTVSLMSGLRSVNN